MSTVPAPTTKDCTGDGPWSKMYLRHDSGSVNRTSPVPGLNVVTSCHSCRSSRIEASDSNGFGVGLTASSWSTSCSSLDLSTNRAMRCSPSPPSPSSARSSSRSVEASGLAMPVGAAAFARWVVGARRRVFGASRRVTGRARDRGAMTAGDDIAIHRWVTCGNGVCDCVRLSTSESILRKPGSFRLTLYRPLVMYVNQLGYYIFYFNCSTMRICRLLLPDSEEGVTPFLTRRGHVRAPTRTHGALHARQGGADDVT